MRPASSLFSLSTRPVTRLALAAALVASLGSTASAIGPRLALHDWLEAEWTPPETPRRMRDDVFLVRRKERGNASSPLEVTASIRGDTRVGASFSFGADVYGTTDGDTFLVLEPPSFVKMVHRVTGRLSDTQHVYPIDGLVAKDVAAVLRAAIEIQRTIPAAATGRRHLAVVSALAAATPDAARVWLSLLSEWVRECHPWTSGESARLETLLRAIVEHEVAAGVPPEDEFIPLPTPGATALHLLTKPGAPELPVPLLLECLDHIETMRRYAAPLLGRRGADPARSEIVGTMRKVLASEVAAGSEIACVQILDALVELRATEALPELRTFQARAHSTTIRWRACRVIQQIDPTSKQGEELFLQEIRRITVLGPLLFASSAAEMGPVFRTPELVPYLVESERGKRLTKFGAGDSRVLDWLRAITELTTTDLSEYEAWWKARFPERVWPIEVKVGDLDNLTFVRRP